MAKRTPQKIGNLLSALMNKVADEKTEVSFNEDTGEAEVVTKAEALVRLMFKMALGYCERDPETNEVIRHVAPDQKAISMIWDRMEGRVAAAKLPGSGKRKATVVDKVDEQYTKAVNDITDERP